MVVWRLYRLITGDISIQSWLTGSAGSWPLAREMSEGWKRPTYCPEPPSPVTWFPTGAPVIQRQQARHQWFHAVHHTVREADLVFVDPDADGFCHGSAKAGRSSDLRALAFSQK
jgi:hypothetical protein